MYSGPHVACPVCACHARQGVRVTSHCRQAQPRRQSLLGLQVFACLATSDTERRGIAHHCSGSRCVPPSPATGQCTARQVCLRPRLLWSQAHDLLLTSFSGTCPWGDARGEAHSCPQCRRLLLGLGLQCQRSGRHLCQPGGTRSRRHMDSSGGSSRSAAGRGPGCCGAQQSRSWRPARVRPGSGPLPCCRARPARRACCHP